MDKLGLPKYENKLSRSHQLKRLLWNIAWLLLARPLPRSIGRRWKLFLLKLFGAKIHKTANVYSSVRIYSPWKLEMAENSCLAPEVDCYNVETVYLGAHSTVSQKAYLCTASHDINSKKNELITSPIIIKSKAWVAAEAFIGMGITVGEGAVVGARSVVLKNVEPWTIVGGNPAKFIKKRELND